MRQNRWGAATEKKGVYLSWDFEFRQLDCESVEKSINKVIAIGKKGEIAISAPMTAKWDMNVGRNRQCSLFVPAPERQGVMR